MLEKLRETSSIKELIDFVKNIYVDYSNNNYIPAVINQGSFSSEAGEDFYLKLVLCHQQTTIKETWITSNLSFGLISPNFDENYNLLDYLIYNVIVFRKVKGKSLYQLNPNITDDRINEYEYDNNDIVSIYYNEEYATQKGKPVLKIVNKKDIHVLKKVFENYLNDPNSNNYPKFKLVAEIEYRTYRNRYQNDATGKYPLNEAYVDYYTDGNSMQVRATIDLGVLDLHSGKETKRQVKVLPLGSTEYRENNPKNFDDDMNAGLVIFDIKILDIIKKGYYIYDLSMYDKNNKENKFMIDILGDKIVFWEGEYNKLPNDLKNKIDDYNITPPDPRGIISTGMSAWQLEVDWNFQKKLYPEQKLASSIKSTHFGAAIDIGISFHIPSNINEFKDFIVKLESLIEIPLESFDNRNSEVRLLIDIRDDNHPNIEKEDIELLYRKYCYQIGKRANYELFK